MMAYCVSDAFSIDVFSKLRDTMPSTSAIGYTSETPEFFSGLPKSTWYDVANPTARRIVYDDEPIEFMFATAGNNWPEFNDIPEEEEPILEQEPDKNRQFRPRIKLIKRTGDFIRRIVLLPMEFFLYY